MSWLLFGLGEWEGLKLTVPSRKIGDAGNGVARLPLLRSPPFKMFAALVLDYRLAFLFLAALSLGTAVPLAFGWARVLPEEPLPFGNGEDSYHRTRNSPAAPVLTSKKRDPFAIVLLLCVTVSYACQLPGVPRSMGFGSIPTVIPHNTRGWIEFAAIWFLALIPGFASVYSLLRPNFLRVPLIAAGMMILLLWLLAAPLRAALEAVS